MSKIVGLPDNGDKLKIGVLLTVAEAHQLRMFIGKQRESDIRKTLGKHYEEASSPTEIYDELNELLIEEHNLTDHFV